MCAQVGSLSLTGDWGQLGMTGQGEGPREAGKPREGGWEWERNDHQVTTPVSSVCPPGVNAQPSYRPGI